MRYLPSTYQALITHLLKPYSIEELRGFYGDMQKGYFSQTKEKALHTLPANFWMSYLAARFTATYSAVSEVIERFDKESGLTMASLVDLGSGSGASTAAVGDYYAWSFPIHAVERDTYAVSLAKKLLKSRPVSFYTGDFRKEPLPSTQVALLSYALGELDQLSLMAFIKERLSLFETVIVIEPGTPFGFKAILEARKILLEEGFNLVAPCPHLKSCPLGDEDSPKWCHFRTRYERPAFLKEIKEGTRGFEEEAYSYLIATKNPGFQKTYVLGRIIDNPQERKGLKIFSLCNREGVCESLKISKSQKDLFKSSKDLSWGDLI